MSEGKATDLTRAFKEITFINREGTCIVDNDPLKTSRRLTEAAKIFNARAVTQYGGRVGRERTEGITESAISAAFQQFGGEDLHPDPVDKAAMLMRGITQGHPFEDGNKRTGFLVSAFYLDQAGFPIPEDFSTDVVYDLCSRVSSGDIREVNKIAEEIKKIWHLPEKKPITISAA